MKFRLLIATFAITASGCSGPNAAEPGSKKAAPPASLDGLATVSLSAESARALGIEVAPLERSTASRSIVVGGEVMVPAGRDVALVAPSSGRIAPSTSALPKPGEHVRAGQVLLSLIPMASVDRDVRARAVRELDAARAEATLSEVRVTRAQAMVEDGSGSQRALDEASAQQSVAEASVRAAESRLRTIASGALDSDVALSIRSPVDGVVRAVRVTPGQSVPPGASLLDVAGTGRWVRASFAAGDAAALVETREVRAARGVTREKVTVMPIVSPPSADPLRGTVDRFFALPEEADWTPGERVTVEALTRGEDAYLAVPATAVVRDAEGGAWVYERTTPLDFRRRRVDVVRSEGPVVFLARGPAVGASIVRVGAPELWGFELGADR